MVRAQSFERGDVAWVNLDPTVGAEIRKRRPCVVVSLSVLNDKRLTVVVVPLSTASTPRPPLVVAVPSAGAGSNARIDQIRAVDKSRILEVAGKLNRVDMEQVEQGLRTVLGLWHAEAPIFSINDLDQTTPGPRGVGWQALGVAPRIASHFLNAELKTFRTADRAAALAWLGEGGWSAPVDHSCGQGEDMQDMTDLIGRARQFAGDAHRNVGQLRKYSGQPYEEHLRAVAGMVGAVTDDAEIIAAAWLHDVVEDTPTTIDDIEHARLKWCRTSLQYPGESLRITFFSASR